MSRRLATYEWYANFTVHVHGALATFLGLVILLGGPRRFASPGFAVARLIPGEHVTWGAVMLACGLLMAAGIAVGWNAQLIMIGFIGQAAWYAFFTISVGLAAARDPNVAFTGVCVYGAMGLLCVLGWACGEGLRS